MLNFIRWLLCLNFVFFGVLIAGPSEKMQTLYKEMSDKLIALRNEYPKAQSQVYAILDTLGKFNTQGQETCKALVVAEQKISDQEKEYKALNDKHAASEAKVAQANGQVEALNKKLLTYQAVAKQAAEKLVAQAKNGESGGAEKKIKYQQLMPQ